VSILIYKKCRNKLDNSSEKSSKIDYHRSPNFENHFRKSDIEHTHTKKSPIYQVKKRDYKFHPPQRHNYDFDFEAPCSRLAPPLDKFDYRQNIYHTENFHSFYPNPKRRIENEHEDYMRKIYYDTSSDSSNSDRNYKMHNKLRICKKHNRSKTPTRIQNKRDDNYFDTHLFPDRNYYQSSIGNKRNYNYV